MKAEWINPFLDAIAATFDHLQVNWERGAPSVVYSPLPLCGITTDIGITGDVQGKFLLSCTMESALMLANQFANTFGMLPSDAFGEMERSAFAEITNLIGGKTASGFSGADLQVNISPPSLIEGSLVVATVFAAQILKIPVMFVDHYGATNDVKYSSLNHSIYRQKKINEGPASRQVIDVYVAVR